MQFVMASAISLPLAMPCQSRELPKPDRERIDREVMAVLKATGAPSASIAIVSGGEIAYEQAYGNARVDPPTAATPAMRYAIGSVSKQFTAAAVLLLEEDGKLSLDDKVSKWFPGLTRANEISIRQLLSMTSGYQDYWPQDYVFDAMTRPATAESIMRRWGGIPLDFEPGSKWQYSNTNYVIAAAIVEKVAQQPFMDFLRQRVFEPIGMQSVADFDAGPLSDSDAGPYLRNALGPPRPAPKEGRGWLFGAGQLAMSAHDLALWDIAVISHTVLKPASNLKKRTDVLLNAGNATGYGLGVRVAAPGGRLRVSHGGAVSGYTSINHIYPEDHAAIVVFTNIYPGSAGAPGMIADRIARVLFETAETEETAATKTARIIYDGLAKGTIDRAAFTESANGYFTPEAVADYAASLAPLGPPAEFAATGKTLRGGLTIRTFRIRAGNVTMELTMMTHPDGRIEQYIIARAG